MARQRKKCSKKCTIHLFRLKPVHYSAFFSRQTRHNYCPSELKLGSCKPMLNIDRKSYTSSFILPCEKQKYILHDSAYFAQHQRFKHQQIMEKTQIWIPKPKTKNSICSVCKLKFQDYAQHISSQMHKLKIRACSFNQDLIQMAKKFGNLQQSEEQIDHASQSQLKLNNNTLSSLNQNLSTSIFQSFQFFKEKEIIRQYQGLQLFMQKSARQTIDGTHQLKSLKSFQGFAQLTQEKCDKYGDKVDKYAEMLFEIMISPSKDLRQSNQMCEIQYNSDFKIFEKQISPSKIRISRPIILSKASLNLDD